MKRYEPSAFGNLLAQHRLAAGLTQEELAERAQISYRTISDVERGVIRSPQSQTVRRLAEALGLSEEDRSQFIALARGPAADQRTQKRPPDSRPQTEPSQVLIPIPPTPFIGREAELQRVQEILARDEVRLLTLTGPGGTGKTRLAAETVGRMRHTYPDGVFFVDLAPLATADLVATTIAATLQLPESGAPAIERLISRLHESRALLLLDNFEHVLEAASIVSQIIAACPYLRVMVTSREILHLRAEYEYPVPPLSLPPERAGRTTQADDLKDIAQHDAVAFFVERACAVHPDFALTPENAAAVAAICRRLDGLPLAIELAAARLRLFTLDALRQRLERRLHMPWEGPRDAPHRQRTLRAAIDWSYRLLTEEERRVFALLSVFAGGWTVEAAEAMCEEAPAGDALATLSSLVDKSLIRREPSGRFTMLETIREVAAERLAEGGEAETARRRHAVYFAGLFGDHVALPPEKAWFLRVEEELANLRLALDWSREYREPEMGLRLMQSTTEFWSTRSRIMEVHDRLRELLALEAAMDLRLRAAALVQFSNVAGLSVEDSGRAGLEEALGIARTLDDPALETEALLALARVSHEARDAGSADAYGQEALRLAREIGDPLFTGNALLCCSISALQRNDLASACAFGEESLQVFRDAGNWHGATIMLSNLAIVAFWQAEMVDARRYVLESLAASEETPYPHAPVFLTEVAAGVAVADGQTATGAELLGAALAHRERFALPTSPEERDVIEATIRRGRAAIGVDAWEHAVLAGRSLPMENVGELIWSFAGGSIVEMRHRVS